MRLSLPLREISLKKYPAGNCFQYFGENPALYYRLGLLGHNGIDLVSKENDPIYAVCDGQIYKSDFGETSFGKGIWLLSKSYTGSDGKLRALLITFFHLNQIYVQNGQEVKAGDVIGIEGNTGFIVSNNVPYWGSAPAGKGVHLHFGVYPLVLGDGGYLIDGKSFVREFPDNGFNGAVDPISYLEEDILNKEISLLQQVVALLKKLLFNGKKLVSI